MKRGARTLFLVRHAIAHERGPRWPDDDRRPLTRDGVERMRDVVAGLVALGIAIDVVATSPLVRAASTADLLVRGLSPKPKRVVVDALAPGQTPAAVAQALAAMKGRAIALVGHEPDLGTLAAWLAGTRQPMPFKKGGVCRLDLEAWPPANGGATLVWFATPKMLRGLRPPSRASRRRSSARR